MTLSFGGISTVTTSGLAPINGGAGSRTRVTQTIGINDAAEQPTLYEQAKEWLPPFASTILTVAPNPNDSYPTILSGITPTASNAEIINTTYISTPPVVYEYSPGYNMWDLSVFQEDHFILECPNLNGTYLGYGRMGNPIFLDFGVDLSSIPAWALWKTARRVWPRHSGIGILYSNEPPTDARAIPFPWHNPPIAPTWPQARGPIMSAPYYQGRSGMICADTGTFSAIPLVGNGDNPVLAATWWGIPPFYYQEYGTYAGTTAPDVTAVLRAVTCYGTVSVIDTQVVSMAKDADADPTPNEILCHLDQVFTSSATLPDDCVYTYWASSRSGSLNDGVPYVSKALTPMVPSHHRGLVQSPETNCPLDLGYILQIN